MLDRRSFIAGSGALALLGPSRPLLAQGATGVRRSIRGMGNNDPDLAAYRRAVAAMKALPASDPRNWIRFADVHRNFCPHGNWYFLPWHRAYLVALENICRQLSGKADFALPYWGWTLQRQVAPAFAAGDRSSNPLNHARPGSLARTPLPDDMVGAQVISRILASPDFEAFGSTRPRGQDSAAARWQRRTGSKTELEFNPHDGVHQAVGGNMALSPLSARDPLFFLHHANVDRLWSTWNARGNANSAEPMWRNFAFNRNFPDGDGGTWDVSVSALGSTPALGYRYDDDDGPFAADIPLPAGDVAADSLRAFRRLSPDAFPRAGGGLRRIGLASGGAVQVAVAENEQFAFRERPIGISVALGRPLGDIVDPLAMRPPVQGLRQGRRYVWATIRDIEPPLDATTRVRTFVGGREPVAMARVNDPNYATSLSFFGGNHAGHQEPMASASDGGSLSVCVDLSPALAAMSPRELRSDRITVQLLPLCASSEMQASRVRPRRVEIVIL